MRRSRKHRAPRGKRIEITHRDLRIFRALARYRYLRSSYLHAFAGGRSETRFKERLGDLFHEGFIDRPKQQWDFADARSMPAVCELRARGFDELSSRGECDIGATTFLGSSSHRQFVHSLAICEVIASIELAADCQGNLRFIPWPEILARAPETTKASPMPFLISPSSGCGIAPDGLFGLAYERSDRKAYRFFALEVDRGTMPVSRSNAGQTSLLGKLCAYRGIVEQGLHKSRWGISTLFVLTLTLSERRLREVAWAFSETGGGPTFLFKAVNGHPRTLARPASALLMEPWRRAGLAALNISESD